MKKEYIETKLENKKFCENFNELLEKIKGKKVLIYGAGKAYRKLDETFNLKEKLNIIAYSDKKFETKEEFEGTPAIPPICVKEAGADVVLLTLEAPEEAREQLCLMGVEAEIIHAFLENDLHASEYFKYLEKIKFAKHLKKIEKKLKGKKVLIYGTGNLFQYIYENYDLSNINIIGISDKKYESCCEDKFFGDKFPICTPDKIDELNPDFILVGTLYFVKIIDILENKVVKNKKIKIKPLLNKPLSEIFNEVWY